MSDSGTEFVRLWTQHQNEVRRYVFMLLPRKADADDVLQETSASLWSKFAEYDSSKPFVAWAVRFARIEVLRFRQKQSREKLVFSDEVLELLCETVIGETSMLEKRRRALDGCLQKLNNDERQVLLARYASRTTIRERAEREGVSVHKLYYVVEKLRGRLLECINSTLSGEGWNYA
ncbi:MAG: sigma-70 family RNA polymerase sigma factor [Planctomycetaceae bacterium]